MAKAIHFSKFVLLSTLWPKYLKTAVILVGHKMILSSCIVTVLWYKHVDVDWTLHLIFCFITYSLFCRAFHVHLGVFHASSGGSCQISSIYLFYLSSIYRLPPVYLFAIVASSLSLMSTTMIGHLLLLRMKRIYVSVFKNLC